MVDITDVNLVLEELREALTAEDWKRAVALVEALRPPDQADVFEELPPDTQSELLPRLNPEDSADILEELSDEDAIVVATRLEADDLTRIVNQMEPDEVADLIGDMPPEQAAETLSAIEDAAGILPLLQHSDDTAGGLMTSVDVVIHKDITATEAIAHLKTMVPGARIAYYLYVVDDDVKLVGVVSLLEIIVAPSDTRISEIMNKEVISAFANTDQEAAARLMARYDLLALPVVDEQYHLLGVITHDDMVAVLEEEETEDIYRLGGVTNERISVSVPPKVALRARLPWLVLNLGTAMLSALVLSLFENTIAQLAVLAVFFPIVAGVSGSAGTQTLTVTVRGLALGEISPKDGAGTMVREILIGLANGIIIGTIIAIIALAWKGSPILGFVVGSATFLNLIAAGLAGVVVPLGMSLIKLDPALASPVLVTTLTDTLGYLIYLSIATILLLGFF
ncbi:MAG: magnesium transporter [Chloroflexota bacterium]|nr:MAG: magnesium transporter [Chloroflexota bacterium]